MPAEAIEMPAHVAQSTTQLKSLRQSNQHTFQFPSETDKRTRCRNTNVMCDVMYADRLLLLTVDVTHSFANNQDEQHENIANNDEKNKTTELVIESRLTKHKTINSSFVELYGILCLVPSLTTHTYARH